MSSARTIIGNYCFKKSIKYILDKVKLLDAKQFIIFSALNIIHKIITNGIPSSIFQLYKNQNKRVKDRTIRTIYKPKTAKMSNHIIYKISKIYNSLPLDLKINHQSLSLNNLKYYYSQHVCGMWVMVTNVEKEISLINIQKKSTVI